MRGVVNLLRTQKSAELWITVASKPKIPLQENSNLINDKFGTDGFGKTFDLDHLN